MPFYEYQCTQCDHRLEVLQKISDEPLVYCPECNEPTLKKLISAAAFRLKGTGWYETDFKNSDKKKAESKNGSADTGGEAKSGGKSAETKKDSSKPAPASKDSGSSGSKSAAA